MASGGGAPAALFRDRVTSVAAGPVRINNALPQWRVRSAEQRSMAKYQRHVFTCVNQRDAGNPKGCCANKGGSEVVRELKAKLHLRGLNKVFRTNSAYCLGQCAKGVTMVIYPDAVWYGNVTTADLDEIIETHLLGGKVVARLVIPDDELTGIDPSPMTGEGPQAGESLQ